MPDTTMFRIWRRGPMSPQHYEARRVEGSVEKVRVGRLLYKGYTPGSYREGQGDDKGESGRLSADVHDRLGNRSSSLLRWSLSRLRVCLRVLPSHFLRPTAGLPGNEGRQMQVLAKIQAFDGSGWNRRLQNGCPGRLGYLPHRERCKEPGCSQRDARRDCYRSVTEGKKEVHIQAIVIPRCKRSTPSLECTFCHGAISS